MKPLTGPAGLDRLSEYREDPDWVEARWREDRSVCVLVGPGGCRVEDDRLALAEVRHLPDPPAEARVLLGLAGRTYYWAVDTTRLDTDPPGGEELDLRAALGRLDPFQAGLATFAVALANWRDRHHYCGRCGAPNRVTAAGHRMACSACGHAVFPRLDPAVIMRITHEDRCLLGRQANWPAGRWSVLAGFVEPGEGLEDAVRREVAEEAGVIVADPRYFASQPWPFPASLMVGFTAEAAGAAITRGAELAEVDWFDRATVRHRVAAGEMRLSSRASISRRLIDDWLE